MYLNMEVQSNGETIRVREAIDNIFNAPVWAQLKSVLWTTVDLHAVDVCLARHGTVVGHLSKGRLRINVGTVQRDVGHEGREEVSSDSTMMIPDLQQSVHRARP